MPTPPETRSIALFCDFENIALGVSEFDYAQVLSTVEALSAERGEEEKVWGSLVKQTLKRRNPGSSEGYNGCGWPRAIRSFGKLLEEAQARGILELELDEKSGGYIVRSAGPEA